MDVPRIHKTLHHVWSKFLDTQDRDHYISTHLKEVLINHWKVIFATVYQIKELPDIREVLDFLKKL